MSYTTSMLTTVADCQALLSEVQFEKDGLDIKKRTLERKQVNDSSNSQELAADLVTTQAAITAMEGIVANLPDGPTKVEMERKLRQLVNRYNNLIERKDTTGAVTFIRKQFDLASVEAELAEADALITAVTDRMSVL